MVLVHLLTSASSYQRASLLSLAVNGATGAIFLGIQAAHHFYLAVFLFITAFVVQVLYPMDNYIGRVQFWPLSARNGTSDHAQLVGSLLLWSQLSQVFAHHSYALSCYPYLATDYPTVLCLFTQCHLDLRLPISRCWRTCRYLYDP